MKVDAFEGPLDLLLHLIQRLEIDIYDIPMADITEQYLLFIHTMKELELDVASEYLVMAATLLAIKSKTLLPNHEEEPEDDDWLEEEDPRDELVERLVEYKKYKEAAEELKKKEEDRGKLYTKAPSDMTSMELDTKSPSELSVTVYDMLGAFQKLLRRKKIQRPISARVTRQEIPIETRMGEILHMLVQNSKPTRFFDLFPYDDREHIVVSFLAVLELMKRDKIAVEQQENFSDLFVAAKRGAAE